MQNIWDFTIPMSMKMPVASESKTGDLPSIDGPTHYRVIIAFVDERIDMAQQMMVAVDGYCMEHCERPTRITVDVEHYETLIAMASSTAQVFMMPDKITLSGCELDIIVDPASKGLRVLGAARDEYQLAKIKYFEGRAVKPW